MEIRIRKSTLICVIIILIMFIAVSVLGYEFFNIKKNNEEKIQSLQNKINELEQDNNTIENNIEDTNTSNTNTEITKENEKINLTGLCIHGVSGSVDI